MDLAIAICKGVPVLCPQLLLNSSMEFNETFTESYWLNAIVYLLLNIVIWWKFLTSLSKRWTWPLQYVKGVPVLCPQLLLNSSMEFNETFTVHPITFQQKFSSKQHYSFKGLETLNEVPRGSYVKLSWVMVTILDCSLENRTQIWKYSIKWPFNSSLVEIGSVVSDKLNFEWNSHRVLC